MRKQNNSVTMMRLQFPQTGGQHCCAGACKYLIKVISVLIIPLVLTIFTVFITFEERKESMERRIEDQQIAREQRLQDLNISNFARRQDREIAQEQRELERTLANERKDLEHELAEKVRHSDDEQRKHELYIQEENRRDGQLTMYINDIGQLLKENNGSLTSNPIIAAIARAKTLHFSRLIGSVRCSQLIYFLYDAGQLFRGKNPLDISGAHFNNVDLSTSSFRYISLVGAHLNNASFVGQDISEADFRFAHLNHANFSRTNCTNSIFESAMIDYGDFSDAILLSTIFHSVQLNRANLRRANCINTTFEMASIIEADFSYANLSAALFEKVDLTMSTFHSSYILTHGTLGRIFTHRNMLVRFMHAKMQHVNFGNTSFPYSKFSECILVGANFHRALLTGALFEYCDLERSNLTDAEMLSTIMNRSSLAFATLAKSNIFGARFPQCDFSHVDLLDTMCSLIKSNICNISCKPINEVLSKHKIILCNNTIHEDPLLQNGHVRCHRSAMNGWNLIEVMIDFHPNDSNKCVFVPTYNSSFSFVGQTIDLSRFKDFIRTGDAAVTIRARMSNDMRIILLHKPFHLSSTDFDFVQMKSMKLPPQTAELHLGIEFPVFSTSLLWLEYIELTIVPRSPQT